jgi:hypothetical protein
MQPLCEASNTWNSFSYTAEFPEKKAIQNKKSWQRIYIKYDGRNFSIRGLHFSYLLNLVHKFIGKYRLLRRVFGPNRDEVTGEWRKLHNEELNDLYSLPNIVRVVKSRRVRWAGHVARMGEDRVVQGVLVGKPEGKKPLGRPRHRWEDNIKMYLQEVGGGRGGWMELAQDRDRWRTLVGTVR